MEGVDVFVPEVSLKRGRRHDRNQPWWRQGPDSATGYGKMYYKSFPPCAVVAFDDSDDIVMCYNRSAYELYNINMSDGVLQVKETRRRLKATHGHRMEYPQRV